MSVEMTTVSPVDVGAGAAAEAPAPPWAERYAGSALESYRRELLAMALEDERIYCLDGDMGGLEESFGAELPERYLHLGIAEANMLTVAAALASVGKVPFVNSMAGFISARACEQVKLDVAYPNLPVKMAASHSGVSAGHLGPTHHSLEDLAIMRALPNLTVMVPADAAETALAVRAAVELPGPVYLRLGRKPTPLVYDAPYDFTPGRAVTLFPGGDVTLAAAGPLPVLAAREARQRLAEEGIEARLLNLHTVKPLDVEAVVAAARETRGLVTVEEHNVIGGLGGAVAEAVAEHAPAPVRRIGFPDVFCEQVGGPQELLRTYGVTVEEIVGAALQLLHRRPGG